AVRRRITQAANDEAKGTAASPWRIVCVASLAQRYKGVDVLIDAVARVSRARQVVIELTVVGDGVQRDVLAARAKRAGVPLGLTGQLPPGAAVRARLDAADLFVLASRTEGLPRAMLEAMARGVPCLGTRVGGVPELLPPGRVVAAGDPRPLAEAIA